MEDKFKYLEINSVLYLRIVEMRSVKETSLEDVIQLLATGMTIIETKMIAQLQQPQMTLMILFLLLILDIMKQITMLLRSNKEEMTSLKIGHILSHMLLIKLIHSTKIQTHNLTVINKFNLKISKQLDLNMLKELSMLKDFQALLLRSNKTITLAY